uniref:Uncharacterized protein n=1 Tax=Oryza punctata TaxID=4537 RepID=A0A0E0KP39_ORYPU
MGKTTTISSTAARQCNPFGGRPPGTFVTLEARGLGHWWLGSTGTSTRRAAALRTPRAATSAPPRARPDFPLNCYLDPS